MTRAEVAFGSPRCDVPCVASLEPYFGVHFERSVPDQVAFLQRHLRA